MNKRATTRIIHQHSGPPHQQSITLLSVGVITISDRASAGQYEDFGGPALKAAVEKRGWDVVCEAVVPDNVGRIQETIRRFSARGCGLILTTGGTGIAERDVTPEAIRAVMRVEIPGFGEVMRSKSMEITPNAILTRGLAAVVDRSLVIALPGKPSGAVECLGFIEGAIPHAVALAQRKPTSC
jgi:molybdopterin adenylyltransferase